jgi:hypothetical protein
MIRSLLAAVLLAGGIAPALRAQSTPPTSADSTRAAIAAARSDLRNMVTAQEAYYSDHQRYAASRDQLSANYRTSEGNTVSVMYSDARGWSGALKSARLIGTCTIFVGLDSTKATPTERDKRIGAEGVPVCDRQPGEGPPPTRAQR